MASSKQHQILSKGVPVVVVSGRTSSKESCDEFMAEWFEVAIMLLKLFGNRGKCHPRLIMSHSFTIVNISMMLSCTSWI